MEIDKSKQYEIIVFPNQDEGLKAQRVLLSKNADFKHISILAVVIPEERKQEVFRAIIDENVLISGHYPFLYRDYKVTALQIYGWLPKTNCKVCGEATCLAFAVKLLQGEQKLSKCAPLSTELRFVENKKIMQEMAEALGVM